MSNDQLKICFFRLSRPENIRARVIINIPVVVSACGCSAGISTQEIRAPNMGIKNFHRFRSDTLTPGLFSRVIHMEMAMAESRLNQASDMK